MDDQQEHLKVIKKELSQLEVTLNQNIGYEQGCFYKKEFDNLLEEFNKLRQQAVQQVNVEVIKKQEEKKQEQPIVVNNEQHQKSQADLDAEMAHKLAMELNPIYKDLEKVKPLPVIKDHNAELC